MYVKRSLIGWIKCQIFQIKIIDSFDKGLTYRITVSIIKLMKGEQENLQHEMSITSTQFLASVYRR